MFAPVIATQLTDRSARYSRLTLDGVDILARYAAWTTSFSVELGSISLTEEGPGGVSSLTFTIKDPLVQVSFAENAVVEFWDIVNDRPRFTGFLQSFNVRPASVGREIKVTCIGIECLLDWILVPNLTIPSGTARHAAIQSLVYNATGIGFPLRALAQAPGLEDPSGDQDTPIAQVSTGFPALQYDVDIDGDSLRDAISKVVTACDSWGNLAGAVATVDFYSGLRVITAYVGQGGATPVGSVGYYEPQDYDTLLIDDRMAGLPGGQMAASELDMTIDVAAKTRGVYIVGSTPSGTGLVMDGSGIPGPVAYINDDQSGTVAQRIAIGNAYLAQFGTIVRAPVKLDRVSALVLAQNIRAGSDITFVADGIVLGAETTLSIYSIRKRFMAGGQEEWTLAVGGFIGSAVKASRRLTRNQRN